MRQSTFVAVAVAALFALPAAFAADETAPAHTKTHFDGKIDTWAEGIVMAIDADGGSLTVRGVKRPYATAYAAMLQEINTETKNLTGDARAQKESEIRAKHADALSKARAQAVADKDSDFTFYIPKDKATIVYFDESLFYDREAAQQANSVKTTDYEKKAMIAFKDLKVGDRVSVGYDAGVIYNNAHAIIKVRGASADAVKASYTSETSEKAKPGVLDSATDKANQTIDRAKDATRLDADTENARQIRKALVADDTLSVKAKNVAIQTENGTFTLKGSVQSEAERMAVEKKAADIVGKERVINQMDIAK